MSKVTIKNLRFSKPEHEWQVKVDRSSVLGNPFYMANESKRDEVCDRYEAYFKSVIQNTESAFYKELERLYTILKKHGKLELFCRSAPKCCHAETIKNGSVTSFG